jgi:hypothetical protein
LLTFARNGTIFPERFSRFAAQANFLATSAPEQAAEVVVKKQGPKKMTAILRPRHYPLPVILPAEKYSPPLPERDAPEPDTARASEAQTVRDPEWLMDQHSHPAEGFAASHPEFDLHQPVWMADRGWQSPSRAIATDWRWEQPMTQF